MRWGWIWALAPLGLAEGVATVLGWLIPAAEFLVWMLIAVIMAYVLARQAPGRFVLHGFFAGLIGAVLAQTMHALFYEAYVANNPGVAEKLATQPLPPRMFILGTGLFIGALYGGFVGALTGLAARVVGKNQEDSGEKAVE